MFWDWGYLLLAALVLIGLFVYCGKKYQNNTLIVWGVMFSIIMLTVFGAEGYSYWFTPEHRTISNGFRLFLSDHPIPAFMCLTAWMAFSWALSVHLATGKKKK